MMPMSPEEELSALDKKMLRANIIDTPGIIMLALGVYSKTVDDPNLLFHPLLADPMISNGLLVVGGALTAWGTLMVISIIRRRSEIHRKLNQ